MSSADASVRFCHCCPDASPVGILVDEEVLFRGVEFRTITDYERMAAGPHRLRLVEEPDETTLLDVSVDLPEDQAVTALAIGTTTGIQPLVLSDGHERVPDDAALVRFVHAIPDAPTVDVAVDDEEPLFEDLAFGEWAGYVPVDPGTHHVEVRSNGETLLPLPHRTFEGGEAITIFAVGRTVDDSLGAVVRADAPAALAVDE